LLEPVGLPVTEPIASKQRRLRQKFPIYGVFTTLGNTGNVLEFEMLAGNLEFN